MVTAQEKGGASQGLGLRPPRTEALTLLGSPSGLRWEAQGTAAVDAAPQASGAGEGGEGKWTPQRPRQACDWRGTRAADQLWERVAQPGGRR